MFQVEPLESRQLLSAGADVPQGEFRVNETTLGDQYSNDKPVGMSNDGHFATAWRFNGTDKNNPGGIFARVYDAGGVGGNEFRIFTGRASGSPVLAMDRLSGHFVVAWTELETVRGSNHYFIHAKRFNAA